MLTVSSISCHFFASTVQLVTFFQGQGSLKETGFLGILQ